MSNPIKARTTSRLSAVLSKWQIKPDHSPDGRKATPEDMAQTLQNVDELLLAVSELLKLNSDVEGHYRPPTEQKTEQPKIEASKGKKIFHRDINRA